MSSYALISWHVVVPFTEAEAQMGATCEKGIHLS